MIHYNILKAQFHVEKYWKKSKHTKRLDITTYQFNFGDTQYCIGITINTHISPSENTETLWYPQVEYIITNLNLNWIILINNKLSPKINAIHLQDLNLRSCSWRETYWIIYAKLCYQMCASSPLSLVCSCLSLSLLVYSTWKLDLQSTSTERINRFSTVLLDRDSLDSGQGLGLNFEPEQKFQAPIYA